MVSALACQARYGGSIPLARSSIKIFSSNFYIFKRELLLLFLFRICTKIVEIKYMKKFLAFILVLMILLTLSGFSFSETTKNNSTIQIQKSEFFEGFLAMIEDNSLLPITQPVFYEQPSQKMYVVITAYSSTPWETWGDPFITASGTRVRDGIVANNLLPFGTQIRIPELFGEEIFVVEDRMHSRKGYYHVDIWFPSYE